MARKASEKEQTGDATKTQLATAKKSGRGGRRPGAGRKPKWGGKTVVMRVPEGMVEEIQAFIQAKVDASAGVRAADDAHVRSTQQEETSISRVATATEPFDAPVQADPIAVRTDEAVADSSSQAPAPQEPEASEAPQQPTRQKRKASRGKAKSALNENQLTLFDLGF